MTRLITLELALAAGLLAAGDDPGKNTKARNEMEKLIGTWACVSGSVDGNPLPEATARELKLKLTEKTYTTTRGEDTLFESTYTIDPGTTPRSIDIVGTEGELAGKTAQGIYEVDGDDLKLCYTMPGHDRPKAFESKPGSGAFFVVWKRVK